MANEMKTDQVVQVLKEARTVAKAAGLKDPENSFVIVGVAQLIVAMQRKEKKVLSPTGVGPRKPDPVQEARKTPRAPLLPAASKKKTTARKR